MKIRGTKEVSEIISCEVMGEEEFHTEYLDLVLSVKLVEDEEEAIAHINHYGSHHTDCILTENQEIAEKIYAVSGFRRGLSKLFHPICGRIPLWIWSGSRNQYRKDSRKRSGWTGGACYL